MNNYINPFVNDRNIHAILDEIYIPKEPAETYIFGSMVATPKFLIFTDYMYNSSASFFSYGIKGTKLQDELENDPNISSNVSTKLFYYLSGPTENGGYGAIGMYDIEYQSSCLETPLHITKTSIIVSYNYNIIYDIKTGERIYNDVNIAPDLVIKEFKFIPVIEKNLEELHSKTQMTPSLSNSYFYEGTEYQVGINIIHVFDYEKEIRLSYYIDDDKIRRFRFFTGKEIKKDDIDNIQFNREIQKIENKIVEETNHYRKNIKKLLVTRESYKSSTDINSNIFNQELGVDDEI
jgi:hypothetical protein